MILVEKRRLHQNERLTHAHGRTSGNHSTKRLLVVSFEKHTHISLWL